MKSQKRTTICCECKEKKLCFKEFWDYKEQYVCKDCMNKLSKR